MNTLTKSQLQIVKHYAVGILIGLGISLTIYCVHSLSTSNRENSDAWIRLLNYDEVRVDQIVHLAISAEELIVKDDLSALNEFYKSQSDIDPTVRSVIMASITHTIAENRGGFQQLFNEAVEVLQQDVLKEVLWTISGAWTYADPIGAFAAVSMLEDRKDRVALWKSIASLWAEYYPTHLKNFINIMPEGVEEHAKSQLRKHG